NAGPAALLRNRTATDNGWVRLELVGDGKRSNRNAVGARVEVEGGGSKQVRFLNGGGRYLSARDRRLLGRLGAPRRGHRATVRRPRRPRYRHLALRPTAGVHGPGGPALVAAARRPGPGRAGPPAPAGVGGRRNRGPVLEPAPCSAPFKVRAAVGRLLSWDGSP